MKDHAHGLLVIHGWVEAVLAIAVEHIAKNKVTLKDHARLYQVWLA
jgi:hypothetical protein